MVIERPVIVKRARKRSRNEKEVKVAILKTDRKENRIENASTSNVKGGVKPPGRKSKGLQHEVIDVE